MWFEFLIFCVSLVAYFIYNAWSIQKRSRFPYLPYKLPFGLMKKVIMREKSFGLAMNELYSQSPEEEPLVGFYMINKPAVLVRDPEIVKMMMTTHFESFSDRGMYPDKKNDPLSASLFSLPVGEWKALRAKLTPAFSSGKIKQMFSQIQDVSQIMQDKLLKTVKNDKKGTPVEIKDLSTSYVIDVMASTIFGIDVNSVTEEDHPFREFKRNFSVVRATSWVETFRFALVFMWPRIARIFRMSSMPKFTSDFFMNLVRKIIEYRETSSIVRHDVIQQLLHLRKNETEVSKETSKDSNNNMTVEECAANSFLFYVAGSETSPSTMCFSLYELSRSPEHLKTAQDEIDRVLRAHDGKMTYESLKEMKFLEKIIIESLRMYPALPMLNRRCTKDFPVPGSDMTIFKDQAILIPLHAIQTDPKYFPNPNKFNPNRIDPEDDDYSNVASVSFGEGPKSCIGGYNYS